MANFIKKRLQVFVSSTYLDLIPERQAAVQAILTAGHIPAGMELFTSGDESQMDVIKQWIDESDVYLLILGGRYGSIETGSGKSYTHLEYEYAIEMGKALFSCVISEKALANRREKNINFIETDYGAKLKEFRTKSLSKMSKFWDDEKDIKIAVGETLSVLSRHEDLLGWVRADKDANNPTLSIELARLSKENAELREMIKINGQTVDKFNGVSFQELRAILEQGKLLDFIKEHRLILIRGIIVSDITPPEDAKYLTDRLISLGMLDITPLVRSGTNSPVLKLSAAGIAFLNRLELENI